MVPKFALDAGDAVCNVAFGTGQLQSSQGAPYNAIIVNGNMHHPGPLDAHRLLAAIEQWSSRQAFMIATLDTLLKKPQR